MAYPAGPTAMAEVGGGLREALTCNHKGFTDESLDELAIVEMAGARAYG